MLCALWHIFTVHIFIFLLYCYVIGGTEENDENREDKRAPSEDSNPGFPEYE
jgi:hypothetical protein